MDPFVDQLKGLCAAYPTRSKWVFVPTHAIGRTIGDRLVLEGTDWANLRFVTPLDIALLMGAPFLVERGIDPSEEELGPALMMRLLLALPSEGGYFRPLAGHPTLAQALWATVRELRMAGLTPDRAHARRVRVPREACRARRAAARIRAVPVGPQTRGHGDGVSRGRPASGLVSDPVAGLLDRTARRELESAPAHCCSTRCPASGCRRARSRSPASTSPRRLKPRPTLRVSPDVVTNPLAFLMTPPSCGSIERTHRPVPCRRSRSGDRRGLPAHSGHRRAARPGRDRVRLGRAHRARVGKGAAPRLAGHAWHWYSGDVHAAGTRADRPLRLDRNRLCRGLLPPPAAVRRSQRQRGGGVHRGPGRARAHTGGSRLGARHLRPGIHAPGQELRGARRRGRFVRRRPRIRQGQGGAGKAGWRLAWLARGLHPCPGKGWNRRASGRRGRSGGVPRTSDGAQQRTGSSGRIGARGIHRRTARAW